MTRSAVGVREVRYDKTHDKRTEYTADTGKEDETSYTPGFVMCRHMDGHPSRPDVAARL